MDKIPFIYNIDSIEQDPAPTIDSVGQDPVCNINFIGCSLCDPALPSHLGEFPASVVGILVLKSTYLSFPSQFYRKGKCKEITPLTSISTTFGTL